MKKWLVLFFLLMIVIPFHSSSQIILPQLKAGVPVNDSVTTINYCFPGNCNPLGDVIVKMDSLLIPLVQGVEFYYLVSQLTTSPVSVSTIEKGTTQVGDTFLFSPGSTTQYSFYSSSSGCMTLTLFVWGTPSTPFVDYPCQMQLFCTLANCGNTCMSVPENPFQCEVSDFIGLPESAPNSYFSLRYDPEHARLVLSAQQLNNKRTIFTLYDSSGKSLISENFSALVNDAFIDIHKLNSGLYFWQLHCEGQIIQSGKINHTQFY
jgi:hypothetical protein